MIIFAVIVCVLIAGYGYMVIRMKTEWTGDERELRRRRTEHELKHWKAR